MDLDSRFHGTDVEENKEDAGASVTETRDLNMFNSEVPPAVEATNGIMIADSNTEHSGLTVFPDGVTDEVLKIPITNFSSPGPARPSNTSGQHCLPTDSDLAPDGTERSLSYSNVLRFPLADSHTNNETEGTEYVGLSRELLDANDDGTFNKVGTEILYPSTDNPLPEFDVKHAYKADHMDFDYQSEKASISNELLNGDSRETTNISNSEKGELISVEMRSRVYNQHTETNEDFYPTGKLSSNNGGTEGEYSGLSSQRTQDGVPSADRELSVSPERSPRIKNSARQEERQSPTNNDVKMPVFSSPSGRKRSPSLEKQGAGRKRASSRDRPLSPGPSKRKRSLSPEKLGGRLKRASSRDRPLSPSPSKRKRSFSPEKLGGGRKRANSRDRSSPSLRRRSPSDKMVQRDSHRRGDSPRKRLSASPRRRESPRRRDRSASRSPVRRRDSSGHRRDYRGRSRSRSPYSRDSHRRSPRRNHSPRRRSSPSSYHSRRRSPRKPWSPPANRNTGIGRPGNNLFIAGFSYVTTERDLEKKFSRFGRVVDVRVVRDRRTGDSRGFGFLSFEKDEDADAAIRAIDQTEWNGRIVLVEKSKTALR